MLFIIMKIPHLSASASQNNDNPDNHEPLHHNERRMQRDLLKFLLQVIVYAVKGIALDI